MRTLAARLHAFQIDSVSVLVRATTCRRSPGSTLIPSVFHAEANATFTIKK